MKSIATQANLCQRKMTNATRQAAYKARQIEAGMAHRSLWIHPDDWPVVKQFAVALKKARKRQEKQQKEYNQP